ncbi:MAG: glycosyltransferase family 2 protein, partial [Leptolyngbyaceae cyanobacterium MAG.088]|nr:glycosyltransferase family 2 protein [Leptolyngbyaceae cyanobacterium MAG.088]
MAELSISAIICTHNRDQYLGAAIDSLLAQTLHDIEIIVVDNGSTDSTAEVVQPRLSDSRLRYVYEPTLGLSMARNKGANTANGDILAYLDDDAVEGRHHGDGRDDPGRGPGDVAEDEAEGRA